MNSKKATVSIQLNWILILIAGAIILVFFTTIVTKQKSVSEANIAETIQTDLQAIFSSAHISTGTSSIVDVPNTDLNFNCEGFKIGNQFAAKFQYAFAPDLIKSERNTLSIFSSDWSIPFRVTNFLYVTSPDVRYIIDESSDANLAQELEKQLPSRYITRDGQSNLFMNKELITDLNNIQDKNNYKVNLITFNKIPEMTLLNNKLSKTKPKHITGLNIDIIGCTAESEEKRLDCYGDLTFFYFEEGVIKSSSTTFIGKASLFAAIFASNYQTYECGMKNAFTRFHNVTKIYIQRTTDLAAADADCQALLNDALNPLNTLDSILHGGDYSTLYSTAYDDPNGLEPQNENIIDRSCPVIY
jgi:hypothetical protein